MKKVLAIAMAAVMVLSLAACGGQQAAAEAAVEAVAEEAYAEGAADAVEAVAEVSEAVAEVAAANKVGVSMPTKDLQRWNQDGDNMKTQLEAQGYEVDLQYASNDVQTQVSQIENMIASGCTVLVIAAIDGESLGTVLETAKAAEIPVINNIYFEREDNSK